MRNRYKSIQLHVSNHHHPPARVNLNQKPAISVRQPRIPVNGKLWFSVIIWVGNGNCVSLTESSSSSSSPWWWWFLRRNLVNTKLNSSSIIVHDNNLFFRPSPTTSMQLNAKFSFSFAVATHNKVAHFICWVKANFYWICENFINNTGILCEGSWERACLPVCVSFCVRDYKTKELP